LIGLNAITVFSRVAATAGTNAHTTSGENNNRIEETILENKKLTYYRKDR